MPTTRNTAVAGYDGSSPFPRPAASARAGIAPVTLTAAVVVAPYIALGAGIWLAWGSGITLTDLLLAAAFYVVTGLGVTVGFRSTPPPHSSACSNVWTGPQTCTGTQATSSSTIAQ
jgi:stearoyl-CoA desaturase (delta-9 desaturase)